MFPFSTFKPYWEYAEGEGCIDFTNSLTEKGISKTQLCMFKTLYFTSNIISLLTWVDDIWDRRKEQKPHKRGDSIRIKQSDADGCDTGENTGM